MVGDVSLSKAAVRQMVEATRRAFSLTDVQAWGGEAQQHLIALRVFQDAHVVALYGAEPFEVPTDALFADLQRRQKVAAYPRVQPGTRVLTFHAVSSLSQLELSPRGLPRPITSTPQVAIHDVDCFVVPGAAFTREGARLGRGGGYYDATLDAAGDRAARLGLTFERLVLPSLPIEAHDARVGVVITERGAIDTVKTLE